jgi:hypothetical protein
MVYYGYRPRPRYPRPPSSYMTIVQRPTDVFNYPTQMFTVTRENSSWMLGGLAGAFVFSKVIKFKPISTIGYIASIGASILALADFTGIIKIGTITEKIPEINF